MHQHQVKLWAHQGWQLGCHQHLERLLVHPQMDSLMVLDQLLSHPLDLRLVYLGPQGKLLVHQGKLLVCLEHQGKLLVCLEHQGKLLVH